VNMPQPNIDMLRKLYDFGGLLVYRVLYFDQIGFRSLQVRCTFSEAAADEEAAMLRRNGFQAWIETFMVNFDGAFAEASDDRAPCEVEA
jgi:hypothetical protein